MSPTASASQSASPSTSEKPALADEATAAGAEAFARYWYAQVNAAYASLDSGSLRTLATSACLSCSRLADSLERSASVGQRYEGGTVTIRAAASPPPVDGVANVLVDYRAAALRVFGSDGALIDQVPTVPRTTVEMTLRRVEGAWRVQEIERISA